MHATVNGANCWQDCMRMAAAVRNEVRGIEAQWCQWQQTNFASVTPKQATDMQLKVHTLTRMIHAIGDRSHLLATADFGSGAGFTHQNAEVGLHSVGSTSHVPLGHPVPSSFPFAHNPQPPDIDELAKNLTEKLSLHFASTVECTIAPDRAA